MLTCFERGVGQKSRRPCGIRVPEGLQKDLVGRAWPKRRQHVGRGTRRHHGHHGPARRLGGQSVRFNITVTTAHPDPWEIK